MTRAFSPPAPLRILRVAAGVFFVPHVLSKLLPPHGALGFFAAAGFPYPGLAMYGAAAAEVAAATGLILCVMTRWAAALAACVLLVASGAVLKVGAPGVWLWNFGVEYPLFWAGVCAVVGMGTEPASVAPSQAVRPGTA